MIRILDSISCQYVGAIVGSNDGIEGHGLAGETIKAEEFLNDPNHLPYSLSVDLLETSNYSTQTSNNGEGSFDRYEALALNFSTTITS